MYYSDNVLSLFRENLDNVEIVESSNKIVKASTVVNNIKFSLWFDCDKQLFGFDMLQGGVKSYQSFEDFISNLNTYIFINTYFIPTAKLIADVFEQVLQVSTVYSSFEGNKNGGFSAIFAVLGENNKQVIIRNIKDDIFEASYLEYTDDKSRRKSLLQYNYKVDKAGNAVLVPTIDYYTTQIFAKYEKSETVEIRRTGISEFRFNYNDGLSISVNIVITDDLKISYVVKEVLYNNVSLDYDGDSSIILDDAFNLTELYGNFSFLIPNREDEPEEDLEEEIENLDDESDELLDNELDESEDSDNEDYEESKDFSDFDEDFDEDDIHTDEEVESIPAKEETESIPAKEETDDFKLVTVKDKCNVVKSIRFVFSDKYYDIDTARAVELHIPIHLIVESDKEEIIRGMLITSRELKTRIFAQNITEDDVLCNELVNKLFS